MHLQCVPQIAYHWFDTVSLYHTSDPSLAATALDTMWRYVTWIDIGLVAATLDTMWRYVTWIDIGLAAAALDTM
ncbi:exportin-T isoform X2 [Canna indica]|uniref:Exportin-T n=1 Tax=Canna indica TaxID=4628 RepID=A0AAQ3KYG0_9LILI|nr:exportin-T isoform X2 [Canna indica]